MLISASIMLFSCKNDLKEIKALTEEHKVYPSQTAQELTIVRSDSAKIVAKIFAKEIKVFSKAEEPYINFPKGLLVESYKNYPEIESSMTANTAIYYNEKQLWHAIGDVVAVNIKGEQLNTEELFWDEAKEIIYSDKFSRISTEDGTFYGKNGFESDQNFTKWKLINTEGIVNVKDE